MRIVKVEFTIELNDNAGTDWLCSAIEDHLEPTEKITEYSVEEVKQ
jgi:hypothetical protein